MQHVMNLCENEKNEMLFEKFIVRWQLDKSGTTDF